MAGEWCERADHPLLNDVILSKVFESVRPTDFVECRVACKKWNVSTIPFTRKTWEVNIYENCLDWDSEWKMENFVEVFRLNKLGMPFARFRLGHFCMTDPVGEEFRKLCGEIAKEIDLSLGSGKFMVEDVSGLLRSTPNLVKLQIPNHLHSRSSNTVKLFPDCSENSYPKLRFLKELKSDGDLPEFRIIFCPSFLEELIEAAENITHLSICDSDMDENSESLSKYTSLEVLTIIEKLGRESCIETLDFEDMEEEHVEILRRMKSKGMKLKRIKVSRNFFDDEHLMQLATLFQDSLEHFRVPRSELSNNSMQFLKMPKLTWLEIHISDDFDLKNLNISNNFPSLEKLELDQFGRCKEYDELFSNSDPCPKIKSFNLRSETAKITGFNRTLTLFPKLTGLYLHVSTADSSVLRNIWTQMTELEVLDLDFLIPAAGNLDSIFTGISIQSLQEVEQLGNEPTKMAREVRMETISRLRNQHSGHPSIANLTNLRRLKLFVTAENEWNYLTDLTGYLGFYALKELHHLDVHLCELTGTCCEILTTDLGLQSWTFRNSNYSNTIPSKAY